MGKSKINENNIFSIETDPDVYANIDENVKITNKIFINATFTGSMEEP